MNEALLTIAQWIRVSTNSVANLSASSAGIKLREAAEAMRSDAPVHAVALSGDGRHLFVASEHDFRVIDPRGNLRFTYAGLPFNLVALAGNWGVATQRSGQLYRFDISYEDGKPQLTWHDQELCNEPSDIYSVSVADEARLIAVGHYGPALTVMDANGRLQWRRHPYDRNPTDGQTWAVALHPQGDILFAGCSSAAKPVLARLDAHTGAVQQGARLAQRVVALAILPSPLAVAAILSDGEGSAVVGYGDALQSSAWMFESESWERFTALAVDQQASLVAAGSNTGTVYILDGNSGALLASNTTLHAAVFTLAISSGRYIAAGLQDGSIAYLEYAPPQEDIVL